MSVTNGGARVATASPSISIGVPARNGWLLLQSFAGSIPGPTPQKPVKVLALQKHLSVVRSERVAIRNALPCLCDVWNKYANTFSQNCSTEKSNVSNYFALITTLWGYDSAWSDLQIAARPTPGVGNLVAITGRIKDGLSLAGRKKQLILSKKIYLYLTMRDRGSLDILST